MTARQTAIKAISNHKVASTQDYLEHAGEDIYGEYVFGEAASASICPSRFSRSCVAPSKATCRLIRPSPTPSPRV